MLINCATQLPAKMPIYSLLIILVNTSEPDFVKQLIDQAGKELNESLQSASSYRRARLLLRFFATLTILGTVQSVSLIDLLRKFVDTAIQVADSATSDDDASWQPYSDALVCMAAVALPFGGNELAESVPSQIIDFMSAVNVYMSKRKRALQLSLCPFGGNVQEDDHLTQCVSFLFFCHVTMYEVFNTSNVFWLIHLVIASFPEGVIAVLQAFSRT